MAIGRWPEGGAVAPSDESAATVAASGDGARFTRRGLLAGARAALPLGLGTAPFGLVLGALARAEGVGFGELVLMSALVFAGAAQTVAVGLWDAPPPVLSLVATTAAVNARLVLLGATLRPLLAPLRRRAYAAVALLTDENWALTTREVAAGGRDAAFLLGSGVPLWVGWVGGTAAGHRLGSAVADPARWGLDAAFPAVFAALLVGVWRGRADVPPVAAAALMATAAWLWGPGGWHVLLGGLAGGLVGAARGGGNAGGD